MSDRTMSQVMAEAREQMGKAVEHTREEYAKIRTGRANPGLITDLPVNYYGSQTPLQQIAGVSVPEPRLLLVNPYDQSALKEIERAIINADLGLNPSNDGQVIRVVFPELTEERRKEYVKVAKEKAEDGRVAVRNIRRNAKNETGRMADSGDITDDEVRRAEKQLQDLTDTHVEQIDSLLANKEKELLEV